MITKVTKVMCPRSYFVSAIKYNKGMQMIKMYNKDEKRGKSELTIKIKVDACIGPAI